MTTRKVQQTARPTRNGSTPGRILTAAERLFAEHGFAGVSMPEIAKASGITAGAIYRHFESKEDLFFRIVQRAVHAVPAPVDGAFDAARDLPRVAASYTVKDLKLLRELAVEVHSASAKHPRVRRLLRQSLDQRLAALAESIGAAQHAGSLDASHDTELMAHAVLVFILGLMHMETLAPELVGSARWAEFVEGRVAALLGVRE